MHIWWIWLIIELVPSSGQIFIPFIVKLHLLWSDEIIISVFCKQEINRGLLNLTSWMLSSLNWKPLCFHLICENRPFVLQEISGWMNATIQTIRTKINYLVCKQLAELCIDRVIIQLNYCFSSQPQNVRSTPFFSGYWFWLGQLTTSVATKIGKE